MVLPTKLRFILPSGFREEYFSRNRPIRNKNYLWWSCLLADRNLITNLYREPSIDTSYQVSVYLTKQLQRKRFFRNWPIRNKNCLWRPCLPTDQNEISNLYRGPSIYASYHVSVHLAKRFHRRFFRNQPIRNMKFLWQPYLFRLIWPRGFRGEDFKKSAKQKQKLPMATKFVNGSVLNEES
jgi:hypothetical protein